MRVMLYPCILCGALLIDLLVLCVACLTVFEETIRDVFGCGCYFVECYGDVESGLRCSVG